MKAVPLKVLLVEDNPGDARLIEESLADAVGDPFDVETADRLTTALGRLSSGGIDAILLDLSLPDSKGQETFDRAKAQAPYVPIIVLTGLGDEALALKMVREGAQDYVAKLELNGSILSRAIRYAIERERADQRIREFNEDLEQRVKQRTAELEAANRELEAFSYSVSHDLRAPLRHIDGFSAILQESFASQLAPEGLQYLDRIRGAAKNMSGLIDDLLRLSQLGRQELHFQPANLNTIVNNVLAHLQPEMAGRAIAWQISELPTIQCDAGLLEQVFANLLGNAIKYTRLRESAVVEIGHATRDGESVIFVRDNGSGFDMQYYDKLFGPFQRLHRQEEFEGTGVGLAIVQRIIHRHGGRIWAESAPNAGATFSFTLSADR